MRSISGTHGAGGRVAWSVGLTISMAPGQLTLGSQRNMFSLIVTHVSSEENFVFSFKIADFHLQTIACSQEVMHFVFLWKVLGVGLFQSNLLELDLQATLSLRTG